MKKKIWMAVIILGILLVIFVFLPIGRDHTNPPVVQEPNWDSPQTRELAKRACFDCHSNETVWPWYSNLNPVAWMLQDHINEGREALNFSEWNRGYRELDEIGEVIQEGRMPLANYLALHPEARLTPQEKELLIQGLMATVGN